MAANPPSHDLDPDNGIRAIDLGRPVRASATLAPPNISTARSFDDCAARSFGELRSMPEFVHPHTSQGRLDGDLRHPPPPDPDPDPWPDLDLDLDLHLFDFSASLPSFRNVVAAGCNRLLQGPSPRPCPVPRPPYPQSPTAFRSDQEEINEMDLDGVPRHLHPPDPERRDFVDAAQLRSWWISQRRIKERDLASNGISEFLISDLDLRDLFGGLGQSTTSASSSSLPRLEEESVLVKQRRHPRHHRRRSPLPLSSPQLEASLAEARPSASDRHQQETPRQQEVSLHLIRTTLTASIVLSGANQRISQWRICPIYFRSAATPSSSTERPATPLSISDYTNIVFASCAIRPPLLQSASRIRMGPLRSPTRTPPPPTTTAAATSTQSWPLPPPTEIQIQEQIRSASPPSSSSTSSPPTPPSSQRSPWLPPSTWSPQTSSAPSSAPSSSPSSSLLSKPSNQLFDRLHSTIYPQFVNHRDDSFLQPSNASCGDSQFEVILCFIAN